MHTTSSFSIAVAAVIFGSLTLAQDSNAGAVCNGFGSIAVEDIFDLNDDLQPNNIGADDPFEILESSTFVFQRASLQYCIPSNTAFENRSVALSAVVDAANGFIGSCCSTPLSGTQGTDGQCAGGSVPLTVDSVPGAGTLQIRPIADDCTPHTSALGPDIANGHGSSVQGAGVSQGSGVDLTGSGIPATTAGEGADAADAAAGEVGESLIHKIVEGIDTFFGNLFAGIEDKRKRSLAVTRRMRG